MVQNRGKKYFRASKKLILFLTERHLSEVDLYVQYEGTYQRIKNGNEISQDDKLIKTADPRFPVYFKPGETKTLYLRVKSKSSHVASIKLFDEASLYSYDIDTNRLFSLYLGGIILLLLYNFFIYISLKEEIYLYYILYAGAFAIWQIIRQGFPPLDTIYGDTYYSSVIVLVSFTSMFITLFSRKILDTKTLLPRLDKILIGIFVFNVLILFYGLLENGILTIRILNAFSFVSIVYMIIVGIISYLKGGRFALYYLFAQVIFLTSVIIFIFMISGFLPYNLFTRNIPIIGSLIEIVLFSLLLIYRIKILRDEKEKIIIKSNEELEKEIQKRTKELRKTQTKLEMLNQNLTMKINQEIQKNNEHQALLYQKNKLSEMGEMINSIAHQWRQPLNRINSNVAVLNQLFIDEAFKDKVAEEKLSNILNHTKYMSETIDDFMSFFSPQKELNYFIIQNVVKSAEIVCKERDKKIKISIIETPDIIVKSFEKEYRQVLLILLNNAIDNFKVHHIDNPLIEISLYEELAFVALTICDNGGGISIENLEKIFDPYFTTKFENEGTGLGLYVAKMLTEKSMKGVLTVKNSHEGACFTIKIPKKDSTL